MYIVSNRPHPLLHNEWNWLKSCQIILQLQFGWRMYFSNDWECNWQASSISQHVNVIEDWRCWSCLSNGISNYYSSLCWRKTSLMSQLLKLLMHVYSILDVGMLVAIYLYLTIIYVVSVCLSVCNTSPPRCLDLSSFSGVARSQAWFGENLVRARV